MLRVAMVGGSMRPSIDVGDVVIVDETAKRCRVGDVVLLRAGIAGVPICHRVVLRVPWWPSAVLVHRGDAPGAKMSLARESRVAGRAIELAKGDSEETSPLPAVSTRRHTPGAVGHLGVGALARVTRPARDSLRRRREAALRRLDEERREGLRNAAEMAAIYDSGAASWEEVFASDAGRVRRYAAIDAPLLRGARHKSRVLDLGCGTGRILRQMDGRFSVGVDVSTGMLARARRRGLTVLCADAHRLPFADGVFSAITAGGGVFLNLDYDNALRECARVLAPGAELGLHQFSARTRGIRPSSWRAKSGAGRRLRKVDEILRPARDAGLRHVETWAWRSMRGGIFCRVPSWLGPTVWNQCVLMLRKQTATARRSEASAGLEPEGLAHSGR